MPPKFYNRNSIQFFKALRHLTAARAVLDTAIKFTEIEGLEARVKYLEQNILK
jgi:hypothetical protein